MRVLLLLSGCRPEQSFEELMPVAVVTPSALEFGDQTVPLETSADLVVTNGGRADLDVSLMLEGDPEFLANDESRTLGPDETWTVSVGFHPESYFDYEALLTLVTNDAEHAQIEVPVTGRGVAAPLPHIEVDPLTLDFGTVDAGGTGVLFFQILNSGEADLVLGTLQQAGSGRFVLQSDPSGDTVAPHASVPVIVQYEPSHADGDSGTVTIPSSDPTTPEVEVVLLGNGGGDFEYPVADIDCPGTSAPPEKIWLDGSASYDPEGHEPLTYVWSLADAPDGSLNQLVDATQPQAQLYTDVAGEYRVQLVVWNTIGVPSAPDTCLIDAIPEDDLHVELTWDTDKADIDLHLIDEGGSLFELPYDCNFCNRGPNWGASATDDDPRLDIDDQGGSGPENINILDPAGDAYDVKVHYYDDHGDSTVIATVKVYTYGALEWTGSRTMKRNEVWDVGTVNWPDGTFGVSSTVNWDTPVKDCY